jgi:hypothetical protein
MASSICTSLFCKISTTNLTCQSYPGGAAEGTVCDSGKVIIQYFIILFWIFKLYFYEIFKICIKGVCTIDSRAPVGDCVLGENSISQDVVGIKIPYPQMKCQDVLDYAHQLGQSSNVYCQDVKFSKLCCTTCISKRFKITGNVLAFLNIFF